MSSIKIGINGAGRIGRYLIRLISNSSLLKVSALNSSASVEQASHLIKYDSVHGVFDKEIVCSSNQIEVRGKNLQKIQYSSCENLNDIEWKDVDIVIDCTGVFKKKEDLSKHLKKSVKKVIIAAPCKDADWTVVYGVNEGDYQASKHHVISNASCTTNCLAPLAKVMDQEFGIESGYMTTVHAYTNDQRLLDSTHTDLRRARAAGLSMIPTSTGAISAIEMILPQLKNKLQGLSVRVPVSNVSLLELTLQCSKKVSLESIHHALESYQKKFPKILFIEKQPLVSQDFIGSSYSAIVDRSLTKVYDKTVQLFAWYDNEAGYSHRLLDVIQLVNH